MTAHQIGLLAGLFVVPALLLSLGHRFRDLSQRLKWTFWGGVIGQVAGVLGTATAMLVPPVLWETGWRAVALHWALLLGGIGGMAVGFTRRGTESDRDDRDPGPAS